MTTFIDFRYSVAVSSAYAEVAWATEAPKNFDARTDNYYALEFSSAGRPRLLAAWGELELKIEADGRVRLGTKTMSCVAPSSSAPDKFEVIGVRISPKRIGIKRQGKVFEIEFDLEQHAGVTDLSVAESRLLGEGSGRSARWSKLFYQRRVATGSCVEIVMDWQNLQSGIPLSAMHMAEELISQSDHQLRFTSYSCENEEAQKSDFVKLFASQASPVITLHVAPPIYTRRNPQTINIGYFVVESRSVSRLVIERCNEMDLLIVPTEFVRDALRSSGARPEIFLIPHGVDLDFFRPVEDKTPLQGGKTFNILTISAYSERKNIYHLVRAYLEEFRDDEDIALHLYLRPEYLTTQNNLVKEFNEWENWHYDRSALVLTSTSYTSSERLRDLYANADVYLLPSNEGFGLTLLEALACGTPAIGLDVGGQADFVTSTTGYPIPVAGSFVCKNMDLLPYVGERFLAPSVAALRKTLRHCFNHRQELLQKGKSARREVEQRYSWGVIGKELLSVIARAESLIGAKVGVTAKTLQPLTWVLGVIDDIPTGSSIPWLEKQHSFGCDLVGLFTRYGDLKQALRAKQAGMMLYRWDATRSNLASLALQLIRSDWYGLLYAGEIAWGDFDRLMSFLKAQPADVDQIEIAVGRNRLESRLFRAKPQSAGFGRVVKFGEIEIVEAPVGQQQAAIR